VGQQQQGKRRVKGFPSPFGWLERSPPVHVYQKVALQLITTAESVETF
jgi:hypothetical protein